jgi:hypothetical protein
MKISLYNKKSDIICLDLISCYTINPNKKCLILDEIAKKTNFIISASTHLIGRDNKSNSVNWCLDWISSNYRGNHHQVRHRRRKRENIKINLIDENSYFTKKICHYKESLDITPTYPDVSILNIIDLEISKAKLFVDKSRKAGFTDSQITTLVNTFKSNYTSKYISRLSDLFGIDNYYNNNLQSFCNYLYDIIYRYTSYKVAGMTNAIFYLYFNVFRNMNSDDKFNGTKFSNSDIFPYINYLLLVNTYLFFKDYSPEKSEIFTRYINTL